MIASLFYEVYKKTRKLEIQFSGLRQFWFKWISLRCMRASMVFEHTQLGRHCCQFNMKF
jgi:hypothetical protein